MSSQSFSNKNYSTVISLNERGIYIKVTDNVNYLMYESNVDPKELRLSIDLEDVYKIMIKCLNTSTSEVKETSKVEIKDSDYIVKTTISSGIMKLSFSAKVGGYLKLNFDILLREKLMSNDGQLTVNFNRLEQQQAQAIKSLTEKCSQLETSVNKMQQIIDCCQIFMTNIYTPQGNWCDLQSNTQTHLNNISAKEITMTDHGHTIWKNISVFYQLEKITINSFTSQPNLKNFKNPTIKELILNCGNNGTFSSLTGIENFPNLEILTVTAAPGLRDVVKLLTESKPKIKTLKFQACPAVNVVELQTYCQVNNVFLALS